MNIKKNNKNKKDLNINCIKLYQSYSKNATLFDFYTFQYLNTNLLPPTPICFQIYNALSLISDQDIQKQQFNDWFNLSTLFHQYQNLQCTQWTTSLSLKSIYKLPDFLAFIIGYSKKIIMHTKIESWIELVKYQSGRDLLGMINHELILINNKVVDSDQINNQLDINILDSELNYYQLGDIYFIYLMTRLEQSNIVFDYNTIILILLLNTQFTKIYITDLILMYAFNNGFQDLLNIDNLQKISCNLLITNKELTIIQQCYLQFPSIHDLDVPIYSCQFELVFDLIHYTINIYNYKCVYPLIHKPLSKLYNPNMNLNMSNNKLTKTKKNKKKILVEIPPPFYHHPYL